MHKTLIAATLAATLTLTALPLQAQQFNGQEAFEVLTAAQRSYSGGSVSTFKPDGTFVFTHKNGYTERGTYRINRRGVVTAKDEGSGKSYKFVIGQKDGVYTFTYRSGPGRGNTYTFE